MSYADRIFGVTTTPSGLSDGIIVNSYTEQTNSDRAEARGPNGKLLDVANYGVSKEITIEGLFVGNGAQVGMKINVGDRDYLITNSTKNESYTAFQTASVTAFGGEVDTVIHELSSVIGD
jgi:hypothetical protein